MVYPSSTEIARLTSPSHPVFLDTSSPSASILIRVIRISGNNVVPQRNNALLWVICIRCCHNSTSLVGQCSLDVCRMDCSGKLRGKLYIPKLSGLLLRCRNTGRGRYRDLEPLGDISVFIRAVSINAAGSLRSKKNFLDSVLHACNFPLLV